MEKRRVGFRGMVLGLVLAVFLMAGTGYAASPNLIANPSMEVTDETGTAPQGWFQGSWGTNTVTFSYPVAGYDGQKAAQIVMSNYVDGDAKWYFQDVAAKAGQAYAFSNAFKSTVASTLTVRFTLADNTYQYQVLANFSASASWQTTKQTLIAPFNAVSQTIFHTISGNGSLTVDKYDLSETTVDGGFDQGFVSLDFDDGWLVTYQNALPILVKAGFKGTWFIITGSFEDPAYINEAEVLDLQTKKQELGGHTKTHPDLTTILAAKIQDEVAGSRTDLLSIGVKSVNSFDYPYGAYNDQVVSAVKSAGYLGARTVDPGFIVKGDDPYLLKAQSIEVSTTFAQVKSWIDTAVQNKSGVKPVFHQIDHSGSQYSSTPEMLQQIVDYLIKQKVPVLTTTGVVALLTGSPPNPESENLVKNPNFEKLTRGWAVNWYRNSSAIKIDEQGLKFVGGMRELFATSDGIQVSAGEYTLSFYQKIENYRTGGTYVWVDEFDEDGNWVSGQGAEGAYENWDGVLEYVYVAPPGVAWAEISLTVEARSRLTAHFNKVKFFRK